MEGLTYFFFLIVCFFFFFLLFFIFYMKMKNPSICDKVHDTIRLIPLKDL